MLNGLKDAQKFGRKSVSLFFIIVVDKFYLINAKCHLRKQNIHLCCIQEVMITKFIK